MFIKVDPACVPPVCSNALNCLLRLSAAIECACLPFGQPQQWTAEVASASAVSKNDIALFEFLTIRATGGEDEQMGTYRKRSQVSYIKVM